MAKKVNNTTITNESSVHCKAIVDGLKSIATRHSLWSVFEDWIKMSAISIRNAVDHHQWQEREEEYLKTIKKYSPEEQSIFPKLLAELVLALNEEFKASGPKDLLGQIFHELELHNKYKGQFFTPPSICELMGEFTLGSKKEGNELSQKGYLTLADECSGAGGLVLGFAKAMRNNNLNYCSQLKVYCRDIDIKCVYMTYLQLSLYGIPAVVVHGDTLREENWSTWYTPVYIWDGWFYEDRISCPNETKEAEENPPESEESEEIK